jgi:hypothetical protein
MKQTVSSVVGDRYLRSNATSFGSREVVWCGIGGGKLQRVPFGDKGHRRHWCRWPKGSTNLQKMEKSQYKIGFAFCCHNFKWPPSPNGLSYKTVIFRQTTFNNDLSDALKKTSFDQFYEELHQFFIVQLWWKNPVVVDHSQRMNMYVRTCMLVQKQTRIFLGVGGIHCSLILAKYV